MSTIEWVKLDLNARQTMDNGTWLKPHYFSESGRLWWPVYTPAHVDPQLGGVGNTPHFHIAWNRLADRSINALLRRCFGLSRDRQDLHRIVIHPEWIMDRRPDTRGAVSANSAPIWTSSHDEVHLLLKEMEVKLMGEEGPFDAVDGACPHRGCPLSEMVRVESDDKGVFRCAWHGIRVRTA